MNVRINGYEYSFEECKEALEKRGYEICFWNGSKFMAETTNQHLALYAVRPGKIPNVHFYQWQDVAFKEFNVMNTNEKPPLV